VGDGALTPHGIDGHNAAGDGEDLEQFRDGGDFIRFRVRLDLAQTQALRGRPRAHHVDRRSVARRITRVPQRLAVDGDHVPRQQLRQRLHSREKRGLEGVGVHRREDPAKRIVGRNPVAERQELAKPLPFGAAEPRNRHPVVDAADHRAQRDHEDVDEGVPAGAAHAGIGQAAEMIGDRRRRGSGHDISKVSSHVLQLHFSYKSLFDAIALPQLGRPLALYFRECYIRQVLRR